MPEITALYAGLLGLLSIVLSARSSVLRGKTRISVGDGGNPQQLLEMRRRDGAGDARRVGLVDRDVLPVRRDL